jgi:hypothetical protein
MSRDVIPERDVYKIAILMVRKHGLLAMAYADMQADQMQNEGDTARFDTWRRILMATEELLASRPPQGARVH